MSSHPLDYMRFVWTTEAHPDWNAMIAAIEAPSFIATHVGTGGFDSPTAGFTYDPDLLNEEDLAAIKEEVVGPCVSLVKYMRAAWASSVCDAIAHYNDTEFRPDMQFLHFGPVTSLVFDTEVDGGPESGYLEECGIFKLGGFFA